jgi:hypothetical protein
VKRILVTAAIAAFLCDLAVDAIWGNSTVNVATFVTVFVAVAAWLSHRRHAYRAAFRVELHRHAAERLRREHPDLYNELLAQSEGSDAEAAARRNPDAYVALMLAELADAGVTTPPSKYPRQVVQ